MLSEAFVQWTAGFKDLPSKHDGATWLNSLAIMCFEHSYGYRVIIIIIVNSMDKIINFSYVTTEGKTVSFNNFLILTKLSRLVNRGYRVCEN